LVESDAVIAVLCALVGREALLLIRVAERRCDTTWRRIATELGRVHAVTLTGSAGTVTQTTPPSVAAAGFLAACGIDPPPRITHLHPA